MGADLDVHTCAPVPQLETSLGHDLAGLQALPDPLPTNSLVILAGNADEERDMARPEAQAVIRWLRTVPDTTAQIASICSGAVLLGQAGLLDGRCCTTHHSVIPLLRRVAPQALVEENRIFVDSDPIYTSAGISTGIDLALYLIEKIAADALLAARIARRLVVYMRRQGKDPQLSPWLAWRNHLHPAVHRAQDAIANEPERAWPLSELAQWVHVSPRHLARLFNAHAGIGISAYKQRIRIARARELLAETRWSLEQVAEHCGFQSARDFRRVWQQLEPDSPMAYRKQCHARKPPA
jgi:transcriptional regulator GlxA family with amidase domain